jgi:uncharacterized protein
MTDESNVMSDEGTQEKAPPYPFWNWIDLAMFAGLAIPCLIAAAGLAQLFGLVSPALKDLRTWTSMLFFYALWFGALWSLMRTRYGRPFWDSLGWVWPVRNLAFVMLLGPLLALSVGMLGLLLRTPQKDLPLMKLIDSPMALVLFGVFSVVLGPLTEELAFRGFFMPLAIRSLGVAGGIVASALPFAILHGPQYAWTWQYVVLIGFAGAMFGSVRYYTGSTLASAAMHSTYNLTFFSALVASGRTF